LHLLTAILFLCLVAPAFAGDPCSKVFLNGDGYTVCRFDPAETDIRLYENDGNGKPYGSFQALEDDLRPRGQALRFAMNGGMYGQDLSPVGLYVEEGRALKPLNINRGWGNFHLLPNGVFYIPNGRAGVMESRAFAASGIRPRFATQSGPMLVIDGRLHPSFLADSTSLKLRNGVGVRADGMVVFAISDGPVRFYDFGVLFRDALDCPNALFLDGSISSLYLPEWQRRDGFFPVGPIVAVVEPLEETPDPVSAGYGLR